jgi:predicted nucleic acid-binding protein
MVEGDLDDPHVRTAIKLSSAKPLCTSWVTWVEVVGKCSRPGAEKLAEIYRDLLTTAPETLLPVSEDVVLLATSFVGKYNLKPMDAIHAATAVLGTCEEFITNDSQFKRVTELNVILVSDEAKS